MQHLRRGGIAIVALFLTLPFLLGAAAAPPAGSVPVVEGSATTVQCGPDQKIVASSATYYEKNGKILTSSVVPTFTTNAFGENVTATYIAPKKAAYVLTAVTCGPASVRLVGSSVTFSRFGSTVIIVQCPVGTVIDRANSSFTVQGWPWVVFTDLPYNLGGYVIFDIETDGRTFTGWNQSQYVNLDLYVSYDVTCRAVS